MRIVSTEKKLRALPCVHLILLVVSLCPASGFHCMHDARARSVLCVTYFVL